MQPNGKQWGEGTVLMPRDRACGRFKAIGLHSAPQQEMWVSLVGKTRRTRIGWRKMTNSVTLQLCSSSLFRTRTHGWRSGKNRKWGRRSRGAIEEPVRMSPDVLGGRNYCKVEKLDSCFVIMVQ